VLQGKPGHRALNKDEPQPDLIEDKPQPPRHLSGPARAEWDRMFPILVKNRLITEADLTAFAAYCQAYGRWQEAEDSLAKQGPVILSPSNFPMQNPFLAISNKAVEHMHKFLVEFGMTPSSRSRVSKSGAGAGGGGSKTNKFLGLVAGGGKASKRSA
jgi:P27 family predicted phage terminase small subunit